MVVQTSRRRSPSAHIIRDRGERFDDSAPVPSPIRRAVAKALARLSKADYISVLAAFHISIDNWDKIIRKVGTHIPVDVNNMPNHLVRKLFRELVLPYLPTDLDAHITTQYPDDDESAPILRTYRLELGRMLPHLAPRLLLAVMRIIEQVMPENEVWQEEPEEYELDVDSFPAHLVCRLHSLVEPVVRESLENAYRDFMAIEEAREETALHGTTTVLRRSRRFLLHSKPRAFRNVMTCEAI